MILIAQEKNLEFAIKYNKLYKVLSDINDGFNWIWKERKTTKREKESERLDVLTF